MLTDVTFFQSGSLYISGICPPDIAPSPTNIAVTGDIEGYIREYETEYLIQALGQDVYREFAEYLSSEKDGESRWDELKGRLVFSPASGEGSFRVSPIANYVYYHYLRNHQSDATVSGVKKDSDEGDLVSAERKMCDAWNRMVDMNRQLFAWIESHKEDYPGWCYAPSLVRKINTFNL